MEFEKESPKMFSIQYKRNDNDILSAEHSPLPSVSSISKKAKLSPNDSTKTFKKIKYNTTANPGPIGSFAFGLTTFLLSLSNAHLYPLNSMILAMGFACGGLAQLFAGTFEWYRGNMFNMVAFISFGTSWWSFVALHVFIILGVDPPDNISFAFYLFIWGVFTFAMFIASFTKPITIRIIFGLLVANYWISAIGEWSTNVKISQAGGIVGVLCALTSIYMGCAEIINETYNKNIFPIQMELKKSITSILYIQAAENEKTCEDGTLPSKYAVKIDSFSNTNSMNLNKTANPSPIGSFAFGLTTFLLSMSNSHVYSLNSMIVALGFSCGGLAQILAGSFEWYRGNMFNMVAFISFGTSWWSFVTLHVLILLGIDPPDNISFAFYHFIWGVFTFAMFIASFKKPMTIRIIFGLLVANYWISAIGEWANNVEILQIGGIVGVLCALTSIYMGCAEVINETYERTILPVG